MLLLQAGAPDRYEARGLACVAFSEQVRTEISTQTGGARREERTGRDGILVLRSAPAGGGLGFEAWYDSLTVWRENRDGRLAPATDGLLGGRWRGSLAPDGQVTVVAAPFVPDDVAEVSDLRGLLADFFPRLAPRALRVGGSWTDSAGYEIRRGGDAGPARRHGWTRTRESDSSWVERDSITVRVRRRAEEQGSVTWDPRRGPVRWSRTITERVELPAGGGVPRAIRSQAVQRIWVSRLDRPVVCQG